MAPRLCLVTDRRRTRGRELVDIVAMALAGGVDAVQLREKDLGARDLLALATALKALCRQHGATLLVNDRIDVAVACGADGVHLPAASFRVADARALIGSGVAVGVSTHSADEARRAWAAGADYVVLGPIFDTASKRSFGSPIGLDALVDATTAGRGPVIAVGGITEARAEAVVRAGAAGIAVIGAVLEADDPRQAASDLAYRLRTALGS